MASELNLDAPISPGALPDLGLGDLLIWAPVVAELVRDVTNAIATGGTVQAPPIKVKSHGRHVTLHLSVEVAP
jgi:hypothetical protein